MKKVLHIFLSLLIICMISVSVYAANGDVVGNIYATDIRACINGVWVDSYNIGGRTVVILEDISDHCYYNDEFRMLLCYGLHPNSLNEGATVQCFKPGKIIGKVYESDIKTLIQGKEVPSYSLNGKMAVAIEDLGGDNTFSDILGRYIWNPEDRTISLEVAYDNSVMELLREKQLNMTIDYATGTISFTPEPIPMMSGDVWAVGTMQSNRVNLTYKGEVVCRVLQYDNINFYENNGVYSPQKEPFVLKYFDIDKLTELLQDIEPAQPTYLDWLNFFEKNTLSSVIDSVETDDYIFMYMNFPNSHGSSDGLVKLDKNTGACIQFDERFQSVSFWGNKDFKNVEIDKENETVFLHYDVDYLIDLKTNAIEPLEINDNLLLIPEEHVQ